MSWQVGWVLRPEETLVFYLWPLYNSLVHIETFPAIALVGKYTYTTKEASRRLLW